ncbi:hypothetical protein ACROYT_G015419 [Oculina patagonica]
MGIFLEERPVRGEDLCASLEEALTPFICEESAKKLAPASFSQRNECASIQTGESQGEPWFKISWSKVLKQFGAKPVLQKKSYEYLEDMLEAAFHLAVSGSKPAPQVKGDMV